MLKALQVAAKVVFWYCAMIRMSHRTKEGDMSSLCLSLSSLLYSSLFLLRLLKSYSTGRYYIFTSRIKPGTRLIDSSIIYGYNRPHYLAIIWCHIRSLAFLGVELTPSGWIREPRVRLVPWGIMTVLTPWKEHVLAFNSAV